MLKVLQADITTIKVDAIVNAANSSLLGGGGVDGAIHRKGGPPILEDCKQIRARQGKCKIGEAVITRAGNLPAQYVIHTVGPVYNNGKNSAQKEQLLSNCYKNTLDLALKHNLKSIAFPNISTGIYKFPKALAAKIAIKTIRQFKGLNLLNEVVFVCFDNENYELYKELINNENNKLI
jgi:O-acetyl-ADP-ribose deacetylase (regulator of RNase III)